MPLPLLQAHPHINHVMYCLYLTSVNIQHSNQSLEFIIIIIIYYHRNDTHHIITYFFKYHSYVYDRVHHPYINITNRTSFFYIFMIAQIIKLTSKISRVVAFHFVGEKRIS
jgi:hypothetical protein